MRVLVFAEHKNNRIPDTSLEVMTAARRLANEIGPDARVEAVALAANPTAVADTLARHGADVVAVAEEVPGSGYWPERAAALLAPLAGNEDEHALLLFPGTRVGREVATRLAARAGLGFAPDVVRMRWRDAALECDRLAYGDKVQITVRGPRVVVVRPGVFDVRENRRRAEVRALPLPDDLPPPQVELVAVRKADPRTVPLDQAEFIVAGGNGVRDFSLIWQFADLVGAAVGGSRVVCDDGRLERARQIGESGVIVSPRCYIAVGISGAIQHVRGMQNSEIVITINTDRHAPINDLASLAVVGDAEEVLRALIERLRG